MSSQFHNKYTHPQSKLETTTGPVANVYNQGKSGKKLSKFDRKVLKSLQKQSEPNSFDVILAATAQDYSGNVYSLSDVSQGDGDSNRTGDQVTPTNLEFRAQVLAGDASNLFRIIIFRWNPSDSSAPTVTSILQGVASTNAPLSALNRDNYRGKLFDVLLDRLISVDTYNPSACLSEMIKLNAQKKLAYTAAGTTGMGKIYILAVSDSAAAAHPSLQFDTRLNYFEEF
jgi:hypothetical protein